MRARTVGDGKILAGLEKPWQDLWHRCAGTVFQTFPWNRIWWEVFGGALTMRVCTLWDRGNLVAVLPCFIQNLRVGKVNVRRLSLFGEIGITGEYSPLVSPGAEDEAAARFGQFIVEELSSHADVGDFHLLPHRSPFVQLLNRSLQTRGIRTHLLDRSLPRTVIDLPRDPDAYRQMLTKRFRRNIAADRRRLEEAGASTEYFHDISRLDEAFNDFVRLHTQAWESRGKEGYFAGKKGFEQFHRSVTAALMPSGEAEILFSRRGEERFAALQLFTAGRTGCPYLSGRDPGHTLARWSPGSILLTDAVARCIARGHRQVDLMEGESEQKHWLGGRRTWYCRLTFYRAGPPGTKGRLFKSALLLRRILELTPGTAFLKGSLLHLAARMRDKISANQ